MRIKPSELPQHLKRTLERFYFVFGEEALQHKEAVECIRTESKNKGYTEHEIFEVTPQFEWERLFRSINTQSLFSNKKLIECRFTESKIGKKGSEALIKIVSAPRTESTDDIVILISTGKIESQSQQSSWFTTLERQACTVWSRNLSPKETVTWLSTRLAAFGFQTTSETIHTLFERTEGNLMAAAQAIEKLRLLHPDPKTGPLTPQDIIETVGVDTHFSLFDLVDAALAGSAARTKQVFCSLKNEGVEPILIVWAIAREVRTIIPLVRQIKAGFPVAAVLQEHGVWKRKESLINAVVGRFSLSQLQQILIKAKTVDDVLKGRLKGDVWDSIFLLCLTLAGSYHE